MKIDLPRVPLAQLPTPVEPLPRLSEFLGRGPVFVKRDDQTGLATGGNKTRKLEFLLAEARASGADTLVTAGSAQSNHCRQTAAAAARCGLRCILVLRGAPPASLSGNLLLDALLGAELRWAGGRDRTEVMEETVREEIEAGRRPYLIPIGGSTGLGAVGYVAALQELQEQAMVDSTLPREGFHRILFASSSGGTHAGLAAGAWLTGFRGEVLGISIDEPLEDLRAVVAGIASETCDLLGRPHRFEPGEIHASDDYLGEGYGIVGEAEREAIRLFARLEGILLDPVYSSRAAAGMIDLMRRGRIGPDEVVLFWHTGGTPALHAYADDLL